LSKITGASGNVQNVGINPMNKKQMEDREIDLIDFIITDGVKNGMSSMIEHPNYKELIELQDKLYRPEEVVK